MNRTPPNRAPFDATLEPEYFALLKNALFKEVAANENLLLSLRAERSQFLRVNRAKIRQTGIVEDALLDLTLTTESKPGTLHRAGLALTLSGRESEDCARARGALQQLQQEVPRLLPDPYAEIPKTTGSSEEVTAGHLLPFEEVPTTLLEPLAGANLDVAGIYAAGPQVRATAHSGGLSHFFRTENFSFDFSLFTPGQRALKQTLAGKNFDRDAFLKLIENGKLRLPLLEKSPKKIERGTYRTVLEPAAAGELVSMFSWQGVSESAIRQGESPLRKCRTEDKRFSPLFSLNEDFSSGEVPRFNDLGELAPFTLPLIDQGKLVNTLVSTRTAKEYGIPGNNAGLGETLRSPVVATGTLKENEILKELDCGLYLSNLHYLNWSDQAGGRITGMTRYACFWVEGGRLIAPIENMRFDDTLFHLFGDSLLGLTANRQFLPDVHTYGSRSLGGMRVPGMLLSKMEFTL